MQDREKKRELERMTTKEASLPVGNGVGVEMTPLGEGTKAPTPTTASPVESGLQEKNLAYLEDLEGQPELSVSRRRTISMTSLGSQVSTVGIPL